MQTTEITDCLLEVEELLFDVGNKVSDLLTKMKKENDPEGLGEHISNISNPNLEAEIDGALALAMNPVGTLSTKKMIDIFKTVTYSG